MARNGRRGFTLIELLVVVGIIVILIAILLPALAAAKKYAQNALTTAELQAFSSAIDMYYQTFNNNYPGPEPAIPLVAGSSTSTTAASNKISGTQNLLLGLAYPVYGYPYYDPTTNPPTPKSGSEPNGLSPPQPPTYAATWVPIPGSNTTTAPYTGALAKVNPMDLTGPIDLSSNPMTNNAPFYKPTSKELSGHSSTSVNDWYAGGVNNINGTANTFKFPTILDRYPDAMPILYYRRMPGVDGSATNSAANPPVFNQSSGSNAASAAIVMTGTASTTRVASFYYDDNKEYTDATTAPGLPSALGTCFIQGNFSADLLAAYDIAGQASLTTNLPLGAAASTYTTRGGYILISAGYDHIFGKNPANGKTDDIAIVGGQR